MKRTIKLMLMIGLPVFGLVAGYLLMARTVAVKVNGASLDIRTHALTVGGALRSAGYHIAEGDSVFPPAKSWLSKTTLIQLDRARLVRILRIPGLEAIEISTSALTAREVLQEAGINPGSEDRVTLNGSETNFTDPLPQGQDMALTYWQAVPLSIAVDGEMITLKSSAPNLGAALWQAGIRLRDGDWVSQPLTVSLKEGLEVEIKTGRPLTIQVDGQTVAGYSAAPSIAEALKESGVTLQDLDYTRPGSDESLPEDGVIRVVRVTEVITSEQRLIPFETVSLADETMFINETNVTQLGENGLALSRVKIRYEDGEEVEREDLAEVVLYEPVAQIDYYGTKLLENYIDTPEGPLQYYMAIDGVATSFSPCRLGVEGLCSNITASGRLLTKGIVAFRREWFNIFKDTRVYVPGYGIGIVGDVGGYPTSGKWIDLGYSDADYVPWGRVPVKIYFLSPAPPTFTGVLP